MTEVVTVNLDVTFEVELDDGDEFDPDAIMSEVRAWLSQYGEILKLELSHDAIAEEEQEVEEG